ncbi:MAG: RND transporter [Prochlorococcus sp. MED-G132]|nr:MAG: RND transporter [Prochlorococcus sp. MED-G132]
MSASNNFITRPVLATVCSLLIVIAGLISIPILPVEMLPDIAPPTVKVNSIYTGADAESVEQGVTSVLEQQINGVENMDYLTSSSSADGVSSIAVAFESGSNSDINQVNVQNRVALAEPQLPEEVRKAGVSVNKASNSILLLYNFVSEDPSNIEYSVETISGLLDLGLTDEVKRVKGVGEVTYFGNRKVAFRLWLDNEKLEVFGLTSADVMGAIESQNRLVPAGNIGGEPSAEGQIFTFPVQLNGRLVSIGDFENMVVRTTEDGGLVRFSDVGRVVLGGESYSNSATDLQGVPSVSMAVYQLSGSNALEVSNGVKDVLEEFTAKMPVGMKMEKIYDNTDFINASINGVTNSLRDAIILVVLILFVFLQNWKATLVPGIAIPVALVGTFSLVLGFGFSLNQLTLFGLVLATGLVVDDAITVIEDTSTKKASGMTALEAAKSTMDELFSAVIATSLVLFSVFLPVLFFPGATGSIYKQFAATIIFAIAISTFNALTFSPMLSALLLGREGTAPGRNTYAISGAVIGFIYGLLVVGGGAALALIPTAMAAILGFVLSRFTGRSLRLPFSVAGAVIGLFIAGVSNPLPVVLFAGLGLTLGWYTPWIFSHFNRIYSVFEQRYADLLEWVLGRRSLVMGILAVGVLLTGVAFTAIPGGFVPTEDQGYAIGVLQAPEGVSTQVTEKINQQVAEILRSEPDITSAAIFSGASFDGNSPNKGLFFVGMRNWDERKNRDQSADAIVGRLNQKFFGAIDGARIFVVEPPAIPGYGIGSGFEFQLLDKSGGAYGLNNFFASAGQIIQQANANPLLSSVRTLFSPESPQLRVEVDRDIMASLDVDFSSAMRVFSANFAGAYVNDTFQEGKVRRVYVQADELGRSAPEKLASIYVKNRAGEQIQLSEFLTVEPSVGPSVISHFNLYRSIKIEGSPAAGKSSGQAINGMKELFAAQNLKSLGFDWTGISREEVKAGALAVVIFALGILVVYLVLAAQYESYVDPLIILMTVPTAMLGALLFLALRGEVLNIYAQVGLVMLIGLAAKNGILIVDLANQRMAEGVTALEAARQAAKSRLRPIIMTAISSLFGFMPLVLASGAGARSQASLGTVVFGGLLVATFLSLFVVPVFYVVVKALVGTFSDTEQGNTNLLNSGDPSGQG